MTPIDLTETIQALLNIQRRIPANISLVTAALVCPEIVGARLAYDSFRDSLGGCIADIDKDNWHPISERDIVDLRIVLEQKCFFSVGDRVISDALIAVWSRNRGLRNVSPIPKSDIAHTLVPEDFYVEYSGPAVLEEDIAPQLYGYTH